MIITEDIKNQFENLGYIKISKFIKDRDYELLCNQLNIEINKKFYENKEKVIQMGGSLTGNVNIKLGNKGQLIWDYLKKNDIEKIISDLTGIEKNKFKLFAGGNLLFPHPKSYNQIFHTDGKKKPRKIILSLCLNEVNSLNGPTELYEKSHKEDIPYWKFVFKYFFKKKYQLNLSVGDIFIREAFIWHRGTKNNSKDPRILVNFIISENKNKDLKHDSNHEISFFDNMFNSDFRGKVKEFVDVKLRPLFFLYKFFRSLF